MLLTILLGALFLEYVADFIYQPRWMATRKSSETGVLMRHLAILNLICFLPVGYCIYVFAGLEAAAFFVVANTLAHGLTDACIWNAYKLIVKLDYKDVIDKHDSKWEEQLSKTYKYWEDKRFYDFIGLDRLLHVSVLVGTIVYFIGGIK